MAEDVPEIDTEDINLRDHTTEAYVCWVDLMGSRAAMARSIEESAIDILSLHATANQAHDEDNIELLPLQDGLYIVSESQSAMKGFLGNVFNSLAAESIEKYTKFKYIIRGSLAYGEVILGEDLPDEINEEFISGQFPSDALILGAPVTQAYLNESKAPPFGIFVHESARALPPNQEANPGTEPMEYIWWRWYEGKDTDSSEISQSLEEYFDWCEENNLRIGYKEEDIERHREMATQYLEPPH